MCILGYATNKRGYKCYDPTSRRLLVSLDVTFFESVMFFSLSQSHSPRGSLHHGDSADVSPCPVRPIFDHGGHNSPWSTIGEDEHGAKGENTADNSDVQNHIVSQGEQGGGTSKELQVYARRKRIVPTSHVPPLESSSTSLEQGIPPSSSDLHLSIAHRKGVRTLTQHPIANFVSYDQLSSKSKAFALSLFTISIPCNVSEALSQKH